MMAQSWRDRWLAQRNQLLANQRFRRWASKFPLTRSIARRDERALFDLTAGFVYSQVLLACVRLRVFDLLADGALPIDDIASSTGLTERSAARLAGAAVSLRLLQRTGHQTFGLGRLGAVMVGNAGIEALVAHHSVLYQDLADPVELLKNSAPASLADYWGYGRTPRPAELTGTEVTGYSGVMSASQSLVADEVLDAYRVDEHRCLLDVGGGDGTFIVRAAQRAPHLQLMLFDLPAVIELARNRLDGAGVSRTQVFAGDFVSDALPAGADLVTLVRVLHDHGDDKVGAVLRSVYRALPTGGVLLIAEPMAGTPGGEHVDAYFNFYLLAMGDGRLRTSAELSRMALAQGFSSVNEIRSAAPQRVRVLMARRN